MTHDMEWSPVFNTQEEEVLFFLSCKIQKPEWAAVVGNVGVRLLKNYYSNRTRSSVPLPLIMLIGMIYFQPFRFIDFNMKPKLPKLSSASKLKINLVLINNKTKPYLNIYNLLIFNFDHLQPFLKSYNSKKRMQRIPRITTASLLFGFSVRRLDWSGHLSGLWSAQWKCGICLRTSHFIFIQMCGLCKVFGRCVWSLESVKNKVLTCHVKLTCTTHRT